MFHSLRIFETLKALVSSTACNIFFNNQGLIKVIEMKKNQVIL